MPLLCRFNFIIFNIKNDKFSVLEMFRLYDNNFICSYVGIMWIFMVGNFQQQHLNCLLSSHMAPTDSALSRLI